MIEVQGDLDGGMQPITAPLRGGCRSLLTCRSRRHQPDRGVREPGDVAGRVSHPSQRPGSDTVTVMFASRRRLLVLAVAAVGLGVFVGFRLTGDEPSQPPRPRVVQPGAPGQSGRALSGDELSSISPPGHTASDTVFMQRMIPHHAQALEMTALVAGRGASREVTLLAKRIEISQRDEIAQMERWLSERGEEVTGAHSHHAGHDQLMPGMLNDQQFGQLKQARGAEFDRHFLQFMIYHHQGALAMVGQLYETGGGLEPASDRFAREVTADQSIEIRSMQNLLVKLT
jgi:uncharacterized protein (DUF305 family)